jgi:DNA-binding NarL/FixJ family response regulator
VKAIVVSGYSDDPVVVEYEHHGFRGALAKPFNVEQLETAISLVMGSGAPAVTV